MDPWGPVSDPSLKHEVGFEDSFLPQNNQQQEGMYVPLDDSEQYLAGLERKLARVQGRSASNRQAESRRLIEALAASRSAHAKQLIENTEVSENMQLSVDDESFSQTSATVDPHGALGSMLRRVAPDRIALAQEELYRLLEADFLSKSYDALEEESQNTNGNSGSVNIDKRDSAIDVELSSKEL